MAWTKGARPHKATKTAPRMLYKVGVAVTLVCSLGSAAAYTTATGSVHTHSLVSDIYVPPKPREDCKGVSAATSDDWCATSCVMDPPNCPAGLCECEGGNPGAAPTTEMENNERKRMADIYENERKNEDARNVAEAKREEEAKEREAADVRRTKDTEAAAKKAEAAAAAARAVSEAAADAGHQASASPVAFLSRKKVSCKALASFSVEWCETNCNNSPPMCPEDLCECGAEVEKKASEDAAASPEPEPEPVVGTPASAVREASSTQEEAAQVLADKEAERMQAEAMRIAAEEARFEADKQRVASSDTSVSDTWEARKGITEPDQAPAPVAPEVPEVAAPALPLVKEAAVSPAPELAAVPREESSEEATAAKIFQEAEDARVAKEAARVAEQESRAAAEVARVEGVNAVVDQVNAGVDAQWEKSAAEVAEAKAAFKDAKAEAKESPSP